MKKMNYITVWNNGNEAEWCKKDKLDKRANGKSFKDRTPKQIKLIRESQGMLCKKNIKFKSDFDDIYELEEKLKRKRKK